MYTVLYLKWITNKDLLYTTRNSAQCYVAAWMGRVSRRMDTGVCVAEPLSCPPETISTLLITCACTHVQSARLLCPWNSPGENTRMGWFISYTPTQNKKF